MSSSSSSSSSSQTTEAKKKKRKDPNKKVVEKEYVWIVTTTHFTDDYKARGGDWSSSDSIPFRTYEDAEETAKYIMLQFLEDQGEPNEEGLDNIYESLDIERGKPLKLASLDYEQLEDIVCGLSEGEFVPQTFSCIIEKKEIGDSAEKTRRRIDTWFKDLWEDEEEEVKEEEVKPEEETVTKKQKTESK
jgi:hypothetical protein